MKNSSKGGLDFWTSVGLFIGAGIIIFLPFLLFSTVYHRSTMDTKTVVVAEKWIKGNGESQTYLVGTEQGVLSIKDNIAFGQFRSSDLYFQIKEGQTYCFKVSGKRIPFLSSYPNIYGFCD